MNRLGVPLVLSGIALASALATGCDDSVGNRHFATTPVPTATATATPVSFTGPIVTFFGIIRADDTLIDPSGTTPEGLRIYSRAAGSGFRIVIEGRPGPSRAAVGQSTYRDDSAAFPDLQVEVSRPLGNGSTAVCDNSRAAPGGVPAVDPANFDPTQTNIDTVNDFACRFRDGQGNPRGVSFTDACVKHLPTEDYGFVDSQTTTEFCGFITGPLAFRTGDTVVTARLRDFAGNPGFPAQIVIRIGP